MFVTYVMEFQVGVSYLQVAVGMVWLEHTSTAVFFLFGGLVVLGCRI